MTIIKYSEKCYVPSIKSSSISASAENVLLSQIGLTLEQLTSLFAADGSCPKSVPHISIAASSLLWSQRRGLDRSGGRVLRILRRGLSSFLLRGDGMCWFLFSTARRERRLRSCLVSLGRFGGRVRSLLCRRAWFVRRWVSIDGGVKCVLGNGGDLVPIGEGKRRYLKSKRKKLRIENWKIKGSSDRNLCFPDSRWNMEFLFVKDRWINGSDINIHGECRWKKTKLGMES